MYEVKALEVIKEFEGKYNNAYYCPSGVLTIGYGHTSQKNKEYSFNMASYWTDKKCVDALLYDLKSVVKQLKDESIIKNANNVYFTGAMVSFTFNCGKGNFNTLVKDRDYYQILENIVKYNKGNGKVLNGLTRRRKAEKLLVLDNLAYVRYGSKGSSVNILQHMLNNKGCMLVCDGVFGEKTLNALKWYQSIADLKCDGICGSNTWKKLKESDKLCN